MLSVREAADILGISQKTVYRWIQDGRLPSHRLGGQHFLERSEVNNLVIREGRRPLPDAAVETEGNEDISLLETLARGGIFYRISGTTKKDVLRNALNMIKGVDESVSDPLFQMFVAREELASTGIGDHIAIPHARGSLVGYISQPILSLSFLETPIDYGALDGQPVFALFLLVSPNVRTHLRILARLSFCLHDPEFKQAVLSQASRETILDTLAQTEARLQRDS
ncbi:MAG: PTS sugar transporter subunit IIA [Planctomycetes bacterium]|nr:PTS sugar transporter subunit IIA [Planctomycetota bacterium]